MIRWHYKVIELNEPAMGMGKTTKESPQVELTTVNERLNALGAEGWELVTAMPDVTGAYGNPGTTSAVLWFKRPA